MNGTHILEHFGNQLTTALDQHSDRVPERCVMSIDPWVAMSLMQKAIRRGQTVLALDAASTLLQVSPERLWRRLGVTAYEDIGVADTDLISLTTVALRGKRFREPLGGEWAVASFLIERMCHSAKCRAGDDLIVLVEHDPDFEEPRLGLTFKPIEKLVSIATETGSLTERAIAVWYAIGTDRCRSDHMRVRKGDPAFVFDQFCEAAYPETTVEFCREGYRKINELLPVLVPSLEREASKAPHQIVEDELPPEELIGEVPCWAFDMHTRNGKQALALLAKGDHRFGQWFRKYVQSDFGTKPLGNLLFRIESGLVDRRYRWGVGDELRVRADILSSGIGPSLSVDGLELLRESLPELNEARRHVVNSNFR